ncbi:hypothetical protein VNO77_23474 [Canavalia gladiata]|uniref:Uncharacterized protein n=1 Tax=Canavalia gladiata TaxID=3824 RepID=A0AAN9L9Q7_CANGL
MILGSMMLESCLIDHLKISNNVKCYSNGGVNHLKNGKITTGSEHPGAKNNDESQPRGNSVIKIKKKIRIGTGQGRARFAGRREQRQLPEFPPWGDSFLEVQKLSMNPPFMNQFLTNPEGRKSPLMLA